ncbi:MAG TPA: hypothetical protein VGN63_07190 [Flavisolibacter sp.]|jgi:hypothetical protein|nr:hypothetical protein [Flavisolibacter sp.]
MKTWFSVAVLFLAFPAAAQYYYKDILGTKESNNLVASYRNNSVQNVTMKSYTVNNTPLDDLSVQQFFSPVTKTLVTITKTTYQPASYMTTFFDEEGRTIKTTDSAAGNVSTTTYWYNPQGQIQSIFTQFGDSMAVLKTDEHIWQYGDQNRISKMLRIKNGKDTSVVSFVLDDNGNVIEEQETRRFIKEEPFYYYYDAKNRLTDIVRYNKKAARLLPEQMFEYSVRNHMIQRTMIPQNSNDYLIWRYRFNDRGLKTREEIFNKDKELTGKVEYSYTFSNQ